MTGEETKFVNGVASATSRRERDVARSLFETREQLEEVRSQLRFRVEAERMRELELQAARRDIEVKSAYNLMLERSLSDRQVDLEWTRQRIDHLTHELSGMATRAESSELHAARLGAELAAERSRVSSRLVSYWVARLSKRRLVFGVVRRLLGAVHGSGR